MADEVECQLNKTKGKLTIHPDRRRFQWTATGAAASPTFIHELAHIKKIILNKPSEKLPPMFQITFTSGSDPVILVFSSVDLRSKAKDMINDAKEGWEGRIERASSTEPPETKSSSPDMTERTPTPVPTSSPPIASGADSKRIRLFGGPLTFNPAPRLSADDIKARAEILRKNANIKKLHEELVNGGLIQENDFWVGKEALVEQEKLLLRQRQGLPAESLVDPSLDANIRTGPAQEVELEMTAEMMERVFIEYPEVHRKYIENVPHKMSENEFWTAYLHCKYMLGTKRTVTRDTVKRPQAPSRRLEAEKRQKAAAEIFGDPDSYRIERNAELKSKFQSRLSNVDKSIDLRKTVDDALTIPVIPGLTRNGYGIAERTESEILARNDEKEIQKHFRAKNVAIDKKMAQQIHEAVKNDPVLTKINERAGLALRSSDHEESKESEALRKSRHAEDRVNDIILDNDLNRPQPPAVLPFKLASFPDTKDSNEQGVDAVKLAQVKLDVSLAWPTPTQAYVGISEGDSEMRLLRMDPKLRSLPEEIRNKFLVAVAAADEFCRHFWASLDDNEQNARKRCRIVQKMTELRPQIDNDLRNFMRQGASDALPLLRLPLAQLAICIEDHSRKCALSHA